MHEDHLSAERRVPPGGSKKLIMTEYLKLRKFALNRIREGKPNPDGAGLTTYSTEKII